MLTLFPLKFYTTSNCHLCEEALEIILQVIPKEQLTIIEIADNDALLIRYGLRIPVLGRNDQSEELDWPFNVENVTKLICK